MKIDCKAAFEVDTAGAISGVAWLYGAPDRVGDVIQKGAFATAQPPIPMLFSHSMARPVGAWNQIVEKSDGLHVSGQLLIDDVPLAREVRALVQAGGVRGLSVGFSPKRSRINKGGGRTISAVDLLEISLVTVPAHPGARVTSVKSAAAAIAIADAINRAAAALKLR